MYHRPINPLANPYPPTNTEHTDAPDLLLLSHVLNSTNQINSGKPSQGKEKERDPREYVLQKIITVIPSYDPYFDKESTIGNFMSLLTKIGGGNTQKGMTLSDGILNKIGFYYKGNPVLNIRSYYNSLENHLKGFGALIPGLAGGDIDKGMKLTTAVLKKVGFITKTNLSDFPSKYYGELGNHLQKFSSFMLELGGGDVDAGTKKYNDILTKHPFYYTGNPYDNPSGYYTSLMAHIRKYAK